MEDEKKIVQKTILVVDDTEANLDIMTSILKDYDLVPVTSGRDALEVLSEEEVDMILLDILMPEMDGLEVCRKLKAEPRLCDIPVIFITSKDDEESIEEAYEAGGIDYVTKPFKPRELHVRIKNHLKMQEMIQKLEYMANHDSLTGIYNRRRFFELAGNLFHDGGDDIYAAMLDIDFFKRINDIHGHQVGDLTLRKITETIQAELPTEAVFGRMGGEEFAVVFQASSRKEAETLLDTILRAVPLLEISTPVNSKISCTISSGLAGKNEDTASLDGLLKEADEALYQAKGSGRNRSIFRD